MRVLEEAKNLCIHELSDHNWPEFFVHLADKLIRHKTVIKRLLSEKVKAVAGGVKKFTQPAVVIENTVEGEPNQSGGHLMILEPTCVYRQPIRPNLRRKVIANSSCVYHDLVAGRVCGSRQFWQVDHIRPVWAGGSSCPANLQVLCGIPNRDRDLIQTRVVPLRK